jgi:hypothetical protein
MRTVFVAGATKIISMGALSNDLTNIGRRWESVLREIVMD